MVIMLCKLCGDFHTQNISEFHNHIVTEKHINSVQEIKTYRNSKNLRDSDTLAPDQKDLTCKICGTIFSTKRNYTKDQQKHILECMAYECALCKKQYSHRNSCYAHQATCSVKEKKKECVKKTPKNVVSLSPVHESNSTKQKDESLIKTPQQIINYLTNRYPDAPSLQQVDDITCNKILISNANNEKFAIQERLISYYRKNKLTEYVGDCLVSYLKPVKQKKQSIWNIDTIRTNFIVKQGNIWIEDCSANILNSLVVKPLLLYIEYLMTLYTPYKLGEFSKAYREQKLRYADEIQKDFTDSADLAQEIKTDKTNKTIIKYISSKIRFVGIFDKTSECDDDTESEPEPESVPTPIPAPKATSAQSEEEEMSDLSDQSCGNIERVYEFRRKKFIK